MTSSGSLYFPVWKQMKATWHVQKKKKRFAAVAGRKCCFRGVVRYLDCAGDFGEEQQLGKL